MITKQGDCRFRPRFFLLLRMAASLWIFASASCTPQKQLMGDPQAPYPLETPARIGEIVHLPTGTPVTRAQMMDIAGSARIVYVGETHDNPASHRLELQVLAALADRHPGHLALGMEMFSLSQQPALDRWTAGELEEKTFLRESHWYENWGTNFAYYRDLLNFARERGIPVIALNADKSLVKAVADKPPDQLGPELRPRLPKLDIDDPYERAMVEAFFSGHGHGGKKLDSFMRVQALWDGTMARSVADYLATPDGRGKYMMVIAGGNHINYGFGIPRRVFRRLPASYVLIGGKEIDIPPDMQDRLMNVELPEFPMLPYDFVAYLAYEKLPETVRLGVLVERSPDGRGLAVRKVMTGSDAAVAGLEKGDTLLALDGVPLEDTFDLMYAVQHKHPGERAIVQIDRHGKKVKVEVFFRRDGAEHSDGKK